MKKQWWKESVVYQIYPRSFMDSNGDGIGDLNGIRSKLDYLQDLGVDVIWLSPVFDPPNDDNGYDIRDYRAIMDDFGTMEDWEALLSEMHDRGLKLVMDLVVNHSSDEHAWFVESKKSKDNPYRDYYIWREGKDGREPTNWEAAFSGSTWELDEATGEYYLHLFSKKQPDLNWEHRELREDVYDMMRFWLDKGIDGFRMDVINFISKDPAYPDAPNPDGKRYAPGGEFYMNGPKIHEYLQEMNERVLADYDVMTVGEMPGVTPDQAIDYTGEDRNEVNMVFQFSHVDIDSGPGGKWDVIPFDLIKLKDILSEWQTALFNKGWNSLYWNNHDQPRIVSRIGHDGEHRVKSAKMLGTLLHMMQGTPYIYQGEEIGMTNVRFPSIEGYKDIETLNMYNEKVAEGADPAALLKAIYVKGRDNARTPMQWNNQMHGGFTIGEPWIEVNPNYETINAEQAVNDPDSVYHYYKKLISLRKTTPVIVDGKYELTERNHPEVYSYTRTNDSERLLVLCNVSNETQTAAVPDAFTGSVPDVLITNVELPEGETLSSSVELSPWEARVYRLES